MSDAQKTATRFEVINIRQIHVIYDKAPLCNHPRSGLAGILTFHSAKLWYMPCTLGTFLCQIPGKDPHPSGSYRNPRHAEVYFCLSGCINGNA